jgi:hypothetical protein
MSDNSKNDTKGLFFLLLFLLVSFENLPHPQMKLAPLFEILVYLNEIHIIHLPPPFTSFPLKRYLFFFNFRCKTPNENDYYTPPGEVVRAGVAGDKEDVGSPLYCFCRSPSPTFSGKHLVKTEFTLRKQNMASCAGH